MRWEDQGAAGVSRHSVIPRTLCFLRLGDEVLLLQGAASKRLWAGKWNGIGGHIEIGETPLAGAQREILEETGLCVNNLQLVGVVHVSSPEVNQGIMIFVYMGDAPSRKVFQGVEGTLQWFAIDELPRDLLVEDLPELIPRILEARKGQIVYGLYQPDDSGRILFKFDTE
jgi:8-oxo-dGTP diphosphatase